MTAAQHETSRGPWPPPSTPVAAIPAGWYADPHRRAGLRWWDGATWTEHDHGPAPVTLRAAVVAIAVLALLRVAGEAALTPVREVRAPWALAAGFYLGLYGVMAAVALWALRDGRDHVPPLRREVERSDAWRGPLVWLTTLAVGIGAALVISLADLPMRSNGELIVDYRERDFPLFAVTAVAAVVVAPLVEELFFRGVLLRGLATRIGGRAAVAAQGIVFGLYHLIPSFGAGNIGMVFVLACYGTVFGAWALHTGRLGPTIVGHAIVNAIAVSIAYAT